jgi:FMN-dependent oxidoreductase (nitrilotriacetate monooxygenase family)
MTNEPSKKKQKVTEKKILILNFFEALTPVLHAPGQWRNPRDKSRDYTKAEYWVKLAQLAERGKLHGIFFGDSLAIYGGYKGPYNFEEAAKSGNNFPKNDPTAYLAAIAISTKNLSIGYTCSTLTEHPYHFARRMATLDHISGGRVGWNIVTSFLPTAGRQLAADNKLPDKSIRYEKADEYVQVFSELLLSSWRDDGVVFDRDNGIFSNPDAIREINYEGKYFKVPGPQISEPSPQRIPLLIQAGASPLGLRLGAKYAEMIYVGGKSPTAVKIKIDQTKRLAREEYGRDPENIKFVMRIAVIVDKTHEAALAKWEEVQKYKDIEGLQVQIGGTGFDLSKYDWDEDLTKSDEKGKAFAKLQQEVHPGQIITRRLIANRFLEDNTFVGTPEEVADDIEDWVAISGIDGFNFTNVVFPESFENIVDLLVPELQKRGLAQTEYAVEGGTFREQIYRENGRTFVPEDHYLYPYRWQSGVSKEEFEKQLESIKEKKEAYRLTADLANKPIH